MAIDTFKLAMELPDEIGIVADEAVASTEGISKAVAHVSIQVNEIPYHAVRVRGVDGVRVYVEWKPGHVVLLVKRPAGWGVKASITLHDKTFEHLVGTLQQVADQFDGDAKS